jgi:hypothetical protein
VELRVDVMVIGRLLVVMEKQHVKLISEGLLSFILLKVYVRK